MKVKARLPVAEPKEEPSVAGVILTIITNHACFLWSLSASMQTHLKPSAFVRTTLSQPRKISNVSVRGEVFM